ncbi:ABC transporter ATP-binding protein [Rhizobium sp. RU36D]|uniref:ABC transporter ATP-binding protein n=1 Tax=Rhizobium sp. RU36D TaxID=1907415 RepID=UPI0009D7D1FC|nr:ABC transporter ATP-binding protein [Rhizobium sp. RU36D]SMC98646.1 peptide/nickel transport system ATP-binding protein [Rhizobium sp. RU36D]
MPNPPLLSIRDLTVSIASAGAPPLAILTDIALDLQAGETLGVVGESGSGKTLLALAVMGLLPPVARATGRIQFDAQDLLETGEPDLCAIRGARIGMIFQEPMTALNPSMTVGDQIAEGLVLHRGLSWGAARREAVSLMDQVRIPDAARRATSYPHELSGGQRQRVGIAMAIAPKPQLLIADEPTTALDVTVQAEVLDILDDLTREQGMALLLVSHDLGIIARMCDRMIVLYAGRRMEEGPTREVLTTPANPYTAGLLAAVPRRRRDRLPLPTIPGTVPAFTALPPGCVFSDRCPDREPACHAAEPGWTITTSGRGVRCIHAGEGR